MHVRLQIEYVESGLQALPTPPITTVLYTTHLPLKQNTNINDKYLVEFMSDWSFRICAVVCTQLLCEVKENMYRVFADAVRCTIEAKRDKVVHRLWEPLAQV